MRDFIDTVTDDALAGRLRVAIQGKGAFRRFKDTLYRNEDWWGAWLTFSNERQLGPDGGSPTQVYGRPPTPTSPTTRDPIRRPQPATGESQGTVRGQGPRDGPERGGTEQRLRVAKRLVKGHLRDDTGRHGTPDGAHNPEVAGSNPAPATRNGPYDTLRGAFALLLTVLLPGADR
jgi:hypothetical protein